MILPGDPIAFADPFALNTGTRFPASARGAVNEALQTLPEGYSNKLISQAIVGLFTAVDKPVEDARSRDLWSAAQKGLRQQIPPEDFDDLLAPLTASTQGDTLVLQVPSWFALERLTQLYLGTITQAVQGLGGAHWKVRLKSVRPSQQQELFAGAAGASLGPKAARPRREPMRQDGLIPRYTFEDFIVGASNQFAHAAAQAVANQPGERYNPFFIYGGVGLGKTHLANAIGHRILARSPETRLAFLSAESFMNELIGSIRRDLMDKFKERFRNVDVLILDDVQFLAGRERTQEEFFHTFNSLHESRRQIILTSDKFPKEIPDLEERLRNRFEWGLIADIQAPDLETRVAILEKKSETENLDLPHDLALFLANKIDSNVRELEGALTRLGAYASLNNAPLSLDMAQEVLGSILQQKRAAITLDSIQQIVCDFFDVRPQDLRSKRRSRHIVLPRQVAMYLCRRHTQASFPVIADHFGGRDHTTAIHAVNAIARRMKEDAVLRSTVERVEQLLQP
jgi:chromosomal replication initiator protein